MAHLGYLLTALADGQLSPATAEKVLEHVAACRPCANELAAERRARRMLAESSCSAMPAELAARLRTIAHEDIPVPVPSTSHRHRRAAALLAVGSLVGASALAGALFVVGSPRDAAPMLSDAGALASLGLVADAPSDPTASAVTAALVTGRGGSPVPSSAFVVTEQHELADGPGRVTELAGRGGHVVVVAQPGRLDAHSVAHLDPAERSGVALHVLSNEPWHAVWQSGDHVVELVTDLPPHQVDELVAHFPADEYDVSPFARLARGWAAVTGGMTR